MNIRKLQFVLLLICGGLVFAGCGKQIAKQTNTNIQTNVNEEVTNINQVSTVDTSVVVEDVAADEVINTSDWLTYENEEYGFSFMYPAEYPLTENQNNIISYHADDNRYQIKIFVEEDVVTTAMSKEEAFLFEDGRDTMPLIKGQEIIVNDLLAYRAFRQSKQGDRLYPNSENKDVSEETWTAVEYNYIYGNDIIRAWFTVLGASYDELVEVSDDIANTFKAANVVTSAWQTYEIAGFSLQYPSTWQHHELVQDSDSTNIKIEFRENEEIVGIFECPIMKTGYEAWEFNIEKENTNSLDKQMWLSQLVPETDHSLAIILINKKLNIEVVDSCQFIFQNYSKNEFVIRDIYNSIH